MVTESKPIRLAEAKARLGRLVELSRKGKTVRFIARSELFEIVHVKRPVVVPATEEELRACYSDPAEIALVNRFGQESSGLPTPTK
jgi:hypothetical protein